MRCPPPAAHRSPVRMRRFTGILACVTGTLAPGVAAPASAPAQESSPADSARLHRDAREAQARMESFREQRIPPELANSGGRCDDLIGRMCLRFEAGESRPLQAEPVEVSMARREVLRTLTEAGEALPGDPWILGQSVFYLVESGAVGQAEALSARCGLADSRWWCDALRGYALHAAGRTADADAAFAAALEGMPPEERAPWEAPTWLLDGAGAALWEGAPAEGRDALLERLWLLSDPLYLVPLNDRRTEHYARRTLVRVREDAANPYGLEWGEDLEELTLRYGGEVAWERQRSLPDGGSLRDTRRIIGRHHPESRDYLPPGEVLERPGEVPVGAWEPEVARPRTGYAPPYAPVIEPLHAQVARFRRGDSLLVVGAFAPPGWEDTRLASRERPSLADNPFGGPDPFVEPPASGTSGGPFGPVESGLFMVPPNGGQAAEVRSNAARDVLTLQVPDGAWVVGLEVLAADARRAWRGRGGVTQRSLVPGLAAVSDLLVLDVGEAPPDSFEEALERVRSDLRLRAGEPFGLAWELYGLRVGETASVAIGFSRDRPGILRRAGEFLRIVQPDQPVVLTWEDAGPDRLGTVFRAVDLTLPELDPGDYTLHLEVTLPGRETMVSSRPITIVG